MKTRSRLASQKLPSANITRATLTLAPYQPHTDAKHSIVPDARTIFPGFTVTVFS